MTIKEKIKTLIGDKTMNDKTIRVNHPEDHPDVTTMSDKLFDKEKKKIFTNFLGDGYKKDEKIQKKTDEKAKRFADTVQTIMSKKRSASEGSFSKGGAIKGNGIALRGTKRFTGVK